MRSEGWWRTRWWLRFGFEVAFKNPSEDRIHYHKANSISDYCSGYSYPVRVVEIQRCINTVLHLQNGQSEKSCPDCHLIFDIHIPENSGRLLSAFRPGLDDAPFS